MIKIVNKIKNIFSFIKVTELEKKINYRFNNKLLLKTSLTHKSKRTDSHYNYERLEFLGDAILDYVVSEWLFNKYNSDNEGQLTQKRAALVKKKFLVKMATKINLIKFAQTNQNLDLNNDKVAYNLNGNIFESLIGAIFLDGGIKPVKKFIKNHLLKFSKEAKIDENYKGQLIEYCQDIGYSPPTFEIKNLIGPDHNKIFTIKVIINNKQIFVGQGKSKKEGEQQASKLALEQI